MAQARSDPDCIFCRIVAGDAPSHPVYEDERTLAFMDIAPAVDGHTLVITRDHAPTLFEAREDDLAAVMRSAHRIAPALRDVVKPAGMRVIQLNGAPAGQTVFHYHLHLIPCGPDGAMRVHGRGPGDPARLAELAEAIASRIGRSEP